MGPRSKMWAALIGAMLTSAQTQITMPEWVHGIVTVILTGLTTYSVWKVENKPFGDE